MWHATYGAVELFYLTHLWKKKKKKRIATTISQTYASYNNQHLNFSHNFEA